MKNILSCAGQALLLIVTWLISAYRTNFYHLFCSNFACFNICSDSIEYVAYLSRFFSEVFQSLQMNQRLLWSRARSYYRCDACHYEYRLQRLWVADVLISPGDRDAHINKR